MDLRILRYKSLPSTNLEALSQALKGADEGLCVVAEAQTAGRGRHGRNWISPAGAGLYFSALLRPKLDKKDFPVLTLAAAIAVCDALQDLYGIAADIKWPNDVLADGKKIAGILGETKETDLGMAVVMGIGINRSTSHLPQEISEKAASIESQTGSPGDFERLLECLARFVFFHYDRTSTPEGRSSVLAEWCDRSSFCRGKEVRADMGTRSITGTTAGIDSGGGLIIRTADGDEVVTAGDVTSLR